MLSIALLLFQGCAPARATEPAAQFECRTDGLDALLQLTGKPGNAVTLTGAAHACAAGWEVIWTQIKPATGYVITSPKELGLRAKGDVYRVNFAGRTAFLIGELPATATRISGLAFSDLYQEAGAIYMDRYELLDTAVHVLGTDLELVLDGDVCVLGPKGAFRFGISDEQQCGQKVSATMQAPVCLRHRDDKAEVVATSECSALRQINR